MKTNFSPPILQLGNDGLDQKLIPHYWHYWHLCTYTPPDITLTHYTDILHTFWYRTLHTTMISYISWYHAYTLQWYLTSPDIMLTHYISWYHTFTLHWYLTHFLISRNTHYADILHLLISHFHTTLISYTLFDNFNISRISKYKFLIFQISICNLWKPKGEINLVFRLETSDPERG